MTSNQRKLFRLATIMLTAVVLAACTASTPSSGPAVGGGQGGAASGNSVPFPAKPDSDPFYQAPKPLPDLPAGSILKSRKVTFAPVGGVPMANDAWQLQFVSHDSHGRRIAAIATVVKPLTPSAGPAPLLAFQYAEDGLGSQCAPSHTVTGGTADLTSQAEGSEPLTGLAQGWTLVYPDHEGPHSAYAAGRIAGQITLDSIRAAEQFAPLNLNANTPVGMWGYSGGAVATAWAASLQKSYAPKLNIVAVASGGTPADLIGAAKNADTNLLTNTAFFNLVLSAIEGINRAYPQLITPILNAKGRAAFKSMASGCLGMTTDGSAPPTGHFADYTTVSDPFNSPGVKAVAPQIDLPQPGESPIANTFVYHSQLDELIPIAGADAMVKAWCKAGSHVSYYRGITGDHIVFEVTMVPSVLAYLDSRFNGSPATITPPGTTTCN